MYIQKTRNKVFFGASFSHNCGVSSATERRKSISIFTWSSLPRVDRVPWQIPSKSWQLPRREQKEGSFYLRHVLVPSACKHVPPGLKVTLYHWEKSLRWGGETNLHMQPGPRSPSATPHLLLGMVMSEAHACWQSYFLFFADLLPLHNWLFSKFVTWKYSRPLPCRCPLLLRMHWHLNTLVSIKMFSVSWGSFNINSGGKKREVSH